jgi:DNA invertase Pin-like site-specific DNA recombinase
MNVSLMPTSPKTVRCAGYCSSNLDDGGAADLNAIRVQRQRIDAYLARQRCEGWVCLPEKHEDLGERGGALKRPALRRLFADAEAGKLDRVVTCGFDGVTRSNSDRARIITHFRRCGVLLQDARSLPDTLREILGRFRQRVRVCPPDELRRHREAQQRHVIRCAVYVRGQREATGVESVKRQRQAVAKFLGIWELHNAFPSAKAYEDIDLAEKGPRQPALRRLLRDVDAGKVDCLVVHTFDRLTEGLVSHEALFAQLRRRDVTLLTLCPEFYHLWGKRMERAWIGDMAKFLQRTDRWQPRNDEPDDRKE